MIKIDYDGNNDFYNSNGNQKNSDFQKHDWQFRRKSVFYGWAVNPPIEYGVSAYVSLSIISNASPTRKSTIAVITMVRTSTRDFVGFFFFFFTLSPPFFMLLLYTNVSIKTSWNDAQIY